MSDIPTVENRSDAKPSASSRYASKKASIFLIAALIVLVMIVWFGFLGWGLFEILQWLLSTVKVFISSSG